jgi:integrase
LVCLKRMVNSACKEQIVLHAGVPPQRSNAPIILEREHNERAGVFSTEEFDRLSQVICGWLKAMLPVAFFTGRRKPGIRALHWGYIDLKTGNIRLKSCHTKADEGRLIPLNQALTSLLKSSTRSLNCLVEYT